MKKRLVCTLCLLVFSTIVVWTVSANTLPEDFLLEDLAQVFFGRLEEATTQNVTISPCKHVKGDFSPDRTFRSRYLYDGHLRVGRVYLCARRAENGPVHMWEVDTLNTKTLVIQEPIGQGERVQQYLNTGKFEAREIERRERLGLPDLPADTLLSNDPNPPRPVWLLPAAIAGGVLPIGDITIDIVRWRKRKSSAA